VIFNNCHRGILLKSLWVLSAVLLLLGVSIFVYSLIPQIIQEPYLKTVTQNKDTVLLEDTISAQYSFVYKNFFFKQGDNISIIATIDEGTLGAHVYEVYSGFSIVKRENSTNINLEVTVPRDGLYHIGVGRYRPSLSVFYSEATNANVEIVQRTTEQVLVTAYRDVTIYPNKVYETAGIVLVLAGIGAGVLSVAQNISGKKNNMAIPPPTAYKEGRISAPNCGVPI